MAEIVNLRQARKAKARRDKETMAAQNRALFGQSKTERARRDNERQRAEHALDGARRGGNEPDGTA